MLTTDNITTHCHNSKLQLISITLLQNISDLTSMKVIRFCTASFVQLTNGTPYDQCTLNGT